MTRPLDARERAELHRALTHDLKTPLTVIRGYAELLRTRDDERTRREAPQRIVEAVDRLRSELDALAARFGTPTKPQPVLERRRILVVDDDTDVRTLLNATLAVDEFELLEAADGERALALAAEQSPELIVLDWQLPDRAGGEVLAELKRGKLPPRVLVLTADRDAAAEAREADAFLTKPFSPIELLELIERLLMR